MQGLTFYAAIVGGVPVLAFLVTLWLSDGAPLAPIGLVSETNAVAGKSDDPAIPATPFALGEP